ncbi:5-formyltetrahydrofolate cyclo-ligase [Flavobacterium sp. F-380]|uniref:5-formyltetrahydrofolate cyclo-ligase n=1 Tax=Flavobacterium kayseriense TaxID=2764714 RepID=A0ABR7J4F5_9FLAO|nr:5-formyltetrahydrofolate cyclo-ligase [Flavobacterium kayseriense]MBC5840342.1 5-formyltetrahydrofolate cyclo-ligase [Flavobacterium kayseriense]MBC5846988.1 5-formyltetrahydrofolate cyclo-ligase [Flavobacterium kayseriense]MBU0941679.1 5-formyltetrahydrofolate cyclo-ligase [Bacteroidota bacterium]
MDKNKKELRLIYKSLRKQLSERDIEQKSLEITNNLIQLPIWDKTYFQVFLPITEQKEVDTELILHLLSGKDKEILISKSNFETREMIHFLLTDNTRIAKNEYNIPEPVEGIEVPSKKIEVVFVPLLAYDKKGNRVGYGKGFYDKFLSECNPDVIKIGLSFFEPEELISDIFEGDVQLDYCVTPHINHRFEV